MSKSGGAAGHEDFLLAGLKSLCHSIVLVNRFFLLDHYNPHPLSSSTNRDFGFTTCSLGGIEGGYDVYIIYILCINFKSCRDINGNILRICAFTSCNEICRYTQNVCIQ